MGGGAGENTGEKIMTKSETKKQNKQFLKSVLLVEGLILRDPAAVETSQDSLTNRTVSSSSDIHHCDTPLFPPPRSNDSVSFA